MDSTAGEAAQQLLITGTGGNGDQPLVLSAEAAAQFLSQAGIQFTDESGQVVIGDIQEQVPVGQEQKVSIEGEEGNVCASDGSGMMPVVGGVETSGGEEAAVLNDINDGTVLYIDPNDPQAAALLQQAGLALGEDGTVQAIVEGTTAEDHTSAGAMIAGVPQELLMTSTNNTEGPEELNSNQFIAAAAAAAENVQDVSEGVVKEEVLQEEPQQPIIQAPPVALIAPTVRQEATVPPEPEESDHTSIQVGPDQQQVYYSVTYEDGKTQQYMMLCPKEMDQNALIQTLVKQISSDPTAKGKKTIRIQKPIAGGASSAKAGRKPEVLSKERGRCGMKASTTQAVAPLPQNVPPDVTNGANEEDGIKLGDMLAAAAAAAAASEPLEGLLQSGNTLDVSEAFESVVPQMDPTQLIMSPDAATGGGEGGTRVYVRCFYCPVFRSTLNSDSWEAILNHILPVCKEEIQTTFYGDLSKHFVRSLRIQVNGRQVVRSRTPSGNEKRTPQCEVVLTHSLVCRKTKREFVLSNPDAAFVANLAKHIKEIQPGQSGRGNSLLCIFCNSPFTYEDYLRHIQTHLEPIVATLSCFGGAYCATSYEESIRAATMCQTCQEPEPSDLRFLPCTRFSPEFRCLTKLQFILECFRENFGDSGFLRINTNSLTKCYVCKSPQAVYCVVFQIETDLLDTANAGQTNVQNKQRQQLSVCVNCQKQFINVIMKEDGFDERLKVFQLRNMEQLCSCLRVILGQAKQACTDKRTLIYSVDETATLSACVRGTDQTAAAVHTVRGAEVSHLTPITRLTVSNEPEISTSNLKAFFVCDLCRFTVDLTSLVAAPHAIQKNDMLLSIVLEHLIPHTESLMSVVASSAANRTINLKFDILSKVKEISGNRHIVLSLQKKMRSASSNLEILIVKDEAKVMVSLRNGIKAEKKQYVSVRPSTSTSTTGDNSNSNATQLIDVNKYVEQQKGKLAVLAQCGCNTALLDAYTECRLCAKFCFPDFRLAGSPSIELCENCVETVLTLCLPSEPETLDVAEECLALKTERALGHRLVLASNVKKWLSVDGVQAVKKAAENYDNIKSTDCGAFLSEALKQHLVANLKTCHNDPDITSAVTGFCITDAFFATSKTLDSKADEETANALASLSAQIGMPIRHVGGGASTSVGGDISEKAAQTASSKQKQIEVKILARRPPPEEKLPTPPPAPTLIPLGSTHRRRSLVSSNGVVIDLGGGGGSSISASKKLITIPPGVIVDDKDEESVSAIQKFLDSSTGEECGRFFRPSTTTTSQQVLSDLKVPSGIKITAAGEGVVNIRAVPSTSQRITSGGGRGGRVPTLVSRSSVHGGPPISSFRTSQKVVPKGIVVKRVPSTSGATSSSARAASGGLRRSDNSDDDDENTDDEEDSDEDSDEDDDDEIVDEEALEELEEAMLEEQGHRYSSGLISVNGEDQKGTGSIRGGLTAVSRGRGRGRGRGRPPLSQRWSSHKRSSVYNDGDADYEPPAKVIRPHLAPKSGASLEEDARKKDSVVISLTSDIKVEDEEDPGTPEGSRSRRQRKEKKIFDL